MGAWDTGNFDNDDVADWIGDFNDDPREGRIVDTLRRVIDADDYLEAPECGAAIAAAEIVAALRGMPAKHLPIEARETLAIAAIVPGDELPSLAVRAIERVRAGSELSELWEEADELDGWHDALDDLAERLTR